MLSWILAADRALPDGPLAQAGGGGRVRAPAGRWPWCWSRAWFASRTADWGQWRGATALLGHGARRLPAGRGGQHLRGVRRRADVPGQSNRLKHKRPPRFGFALPSLEQSERLNRGAITLAFPLLTFGLLIGVVLDLAARRGRRRGLPLRWTDPKVVSALADVAGLRRAAARPVPAGDAGPERDGADDPGVRVPGLHLGRRRGAAPAHGARRDGGRGRRGGRREAPGPGGRSPLGTRLGPRGPAFDGRKGADGLDALARTFPGTSSSSSRPATGSRSTPRASPAASPRPRP